MYDMASLADMMRFAEASRQWDMQRNPQNYQQTPMQQTPQTMAGMASTMPKPGRQAQGEMALGMGLSQLAGPQQNALANLGFLLADPRLQQVFMSQRGGQQ